MAKMTLLAMVQDILSDMTSDNVNSISDTVESEQVAQVIKTLYLEMVDDPALKLNHTYSLFQLTPSGDTDIPTHMYLPDNVGLMEWVMYNCILDVADPINYTPVRYITPAEFSQMSAARNSSETNIQSVTDPESSVTLLIRNDVNPSVWTSYDDETLVFDAFNSDVDSTLQQSKTQCWGRLAPTWVHEDDAYPDLPDNLFSYLLTHAKEYCFDTIKQQPNRSVSKRARSQDIKVTRAKQRTRNVIGEGPNWGRK